MSIALLQQYMQEQNLSQNQVASQLNKSPAVVSQYLKSIYKGDVQSLDKAVVQLVERVAQKKMDVKSEFVPTVTAKKIMRTCGIAHGTNDIYLVIGEAGLGKTVALKEYTKRNANVVMLEIDPTYNVKNLLAELCNMLGVTLGSARSNHAMFEAVVEKLKGSERLLIVDEAELLSYKALEIIRRVHDKAGIGIVLAGMPRLIGNLRGGKGEYKQLYSRIGFALDIKKALPDEDIALLCECGLGTDAFNDKLIKVSHGNARRLSKLLRGVNRMAQTDGVAVNDEHIQQFTEMLID